ncbi:DNA polymerase III subunit beta [Flavihumibacter petaseus]|uniref:Beta sliding clamp n=1 Tax=Flavihumibacter petaseus NBRC 106054 TaxID=1220578 RepID=A0A0E9N325_9BACT|nr:DNA polymerase III subunit beta [Flavihumibacter petaseus]GAO43760.1 hypothetical protein FPE01S_02_08660 [Flavihumibacter petaseus NBRC 106054]
MQKVILSSDALKAGLKKLSQAISKKSVMPVLQNVLCKVSEGHMEMISSDLELTIKLVLEVEAKESFQFLLPFEFVSKIVGILKVQPIAIEVETSRVALRAEHDLFEIGGFEGAELYPAVPDIPKKNRTILNNELLFWLGRAMDTVSSDENRPAMMKACLDIKAESLTIASTNATMLFTKVAAVESANVDQLLITPKVAKVLEGFAEAEVFWHKKQIAFKSSHMTVIATRHEDKFPDYKVVIPDFKANLTLERSVLVEALEKSSLSSSTLTTVFLTRGKETQTIYFETFDQDLDRKILIDITGDYTGTVDQVAINPKSMLTLLKQVDFGEISLHIEKPASPVLISSTEDAGYLSLLVPYKIND